jgi:cytochrome c oxidase subunit IV
MSEYPQGPASQQPGRRIPAGLDPRSYDPRKAIDPAAMRAQAQKISRAQAVARAQASAASAVFLATIVSLATSAFGVVAALAWNQAIQDNLSLITKNYVHGLSKEQTELVYAIIVTVLAVIAIVVLNRVAARIAKKSALDVAEAEQGSI